MGKRIQAYFEQADRLGGLVARMRLASMARITSTEAATLADEPEILMRLGRAFETVEKQFLQPSPGPASSQRKPGPAGEVVAPQLGENRTLLLRRYLSTYADLMAQRSLIVKDLDSTSRRANEASSLTLTVNRVSVWFLAEGGSKIRCADLYEATTGQHHSGAELSASDFGPYFQALRTERTIAANDAHLDPRTACFSESYLKPLGINSMLDVPIWVNSQMVGVVCHEHVGPSRQWDSDEETFAYLMANFVAIALEQQAAPAEP
ncbi:MAG: hypothetical protein RJA70_1919 [Pseudomonadota bacterium]|jgi:GAF domain-containing protein